MNLETMDERDLLAWINSLNICTFKLEKNVFGTRVPICENASGRIELGLARYSSNMGEKSNRQGIHIKVNYKTKPRPWDGMTYTTLDPGEIEKDTRRYAEAFGMLNPQLSLF